MKDNHRYNSMLSASYVPDNDLPECPRINSKRYVYSTARGKMVDFMSDNVVAGVYGNGCGSW